MNLQQDNAPAHQKMKNATNEPWVAELEMIMMDPQARMTIKEKEQVHNSPDMNINDLGFFVSLQADS